MKTIPVTVNLLQPEKQAIPEAVISFVKSHPQTSWFHMEPVLGYSPAQKLFSPVLFVAHREESVVGCIVAFHIHPAGTNRYSTAYTRVQSNGAPLIDPIDKDKEQVLFLLLQNILKYAKSNSALLEFRNNYDTMKDLTTWIHLGFSFSDHLNLLKTITTPEILWQELGENRRRQIKKATKNGTIVKPAESINQVDEFYSILKNLYKNKVKKNIPPVTFFHDFYHISLSERNGVILLGFREGEVIGGIVCPIQDKKCMYEWYVCGKDKENPNNHPSIMVTWHALLYAWEHGIQTFDFMGLGKPGIPYGVRDFKLRFGGEVVNYGRYLLDKRTNHTQTKKITT